jgi:hypothetical protein
MSKRSRDDYDDRVFNGDRDRGGNGGSSSGRSHGQNKKVGERFTGKVSGWSEQPHVHGQGRNAHGWSSVAAQTRFARKG